MVGVRPPVAQRGRERERQSEREYYQRERERDVRVLREGLVGQSRENGERERLVGQSREKKEDGERESLVVVVGMCVFFTCVCRVSRGLMDRSTIRRGAHATMGVGARPRRLGPGERARVVCEL